MLSQAAVWTPLHDNAWLAVRRIQTEAVHLQQVGSKVDGLANVDLVLCGHTRTPTAVTRETLTNDAPHTQYD